MSTILAIDPGKGGAIALLRNGQPQWVEKWSDEWEMSSLVLDVQNAFADVTAIIENVHSMPGQGVVSMFSFGENYGIWRGILIAFGIPHERISPQKWQSFYGLSSIHKGADRKRILCQLAKERFPSMKPTLKTCDALLLGNYAAQTDKRLNHL